MTDPQGQPGDPATPPGVAPGATGGDPPASLPNGLIELPEANPEAPEAPPEPSAAEGRAAEPHGGSGKRGNRGGPPPPERRCKARSRTNGGARCGNWTVPGKEVCRFHGGKSPRGPAHYNFQGKGYALDLPKPLAKVYEEAQGDPELLSMRNEAALLQVRMHQLVQRLGTGEHGQLWSRLQDAWRSFQRAMRAGSDAEVQAAIAEIGNLVEQGVSTEKSWNEVCQMVDRKTTVASREWKRLVDLQQTITADKAMSFVTAIAWSVRQHVTDPAAQRAIAEDVMRIVGNAKTPSPGATTAEPNGLPKP